MNGPRKTEAGCSRRISRGPSAKGAASRKAPRSTSSARPTTTTPPSARWNRTKHVWYCDVCDTGGGALDLARRLGLSPSEPEQSGLSLAEFADAKGLPVEFLRSVGIREGTARHRTTEVRRHPLSNRGRRGYQRSQAPGTDGQPRFIWRRGDKAMLYGLWRQQDTSRGVFLVEGETDALTLWLTDYAAFGVPGASTWKEAWRSSLQDADPIYIWREPDHGGDTLVARVTVDIPDALVIDAPTGIKDPNTLWLSLGCDEPSFRTQLDRLMQAARPASQIRQKALTDEARELYQLARDLLEDPRLLDRIVEAIKGRGTREIRHRHSSSTSR